VGGDVLGYRGSHSSSIIIIIDKPPPVLQALSYCWALWRKVDLFVPKPIQLLSNSFEIKGSEIQK